MQYILFISFLFLFHSLDTLITFNYCTQNNMQFFKILFHSKIIIILLHMSLDDETNPLKIYLNRKYSTPPSNNFETKKHHCAQTSKNFALIFFFFNFCFYVKIFKVKNLNFPTFKGLEGKVIHFSYHWSHI